MAYLDAVQFVSGTSGTSDFSVGAAVVGYQTPAAAAAVNGAPYAYRAESVDLSQWEYGVTFYSTTGPTVPRSIVLGNSSNTTSKISFTNPPNVGIVDLAVNRAIDPFAQYRISGGV